MKPKQNITLQVSNCVGCLIISALCSTPFIALYMVIQFIIDLIQK